MEKIFSAHLDANGHTVEYHVVFENEQYIFSSDDPLAPKETFSFSREENEWIANDDIEPGLSRQALQQLDKYLLSQH